MSIRTLKKLISTLLLCTLSLSLMGGLTAASATEGPVEISFSYDAGIGSAVEDLINDFNASQSDYVVKTAVLPFDANTVHDDFVNKLVSGDTSVDVMALDVVYTAEFASAGWLVDITEEFEQSDLDAFLPGSMGTAIYMDKVYGLPWFANASVLFYRTDVIEQLGVDVPTTYEGWMALQEQAMGVEGIEYVADFQASQSEALVCNWVEFIWNNGDDVLDAEYKPIINTENNVEATELMLDLVQNYAPAGITTYAETESEQVFIDGKALFLRTWPGFWSVAQRDGSKVKDKIAVVPQPLGPKGDVPHSCLGGLNLVINGHIDDAHKEGALAFLRYATQADVQKKFTLTSAQPPVIQSVYQDAEILEAIPLYEIFFDIIREGKSRPMSPQYAKVSDAIQRHIHGALTGATPVKDALDALQAEVEGL